MPEFLIYYRGKNDTSADPLFGGKPIEAVDEAGAKIKALMKAPNLRIGRIYTKPAPSPVAIDITKDHITAKIVTKTVEAMSPEDMQRVLKGEEHA